MTTRTDLTAAIAGVLLANAVPHAYAAATGARQLTPLRGRTSGPATNAVWAAINVAGSWALARRGSTPRARVAFKMGAAAFTGWVLASEWLTDLNG